MTNMFELINQSINIQNGHLQLTNSLMNEISHINKSLLIHLILLFLLFIYCVYLEFKQKDLKLKIQILEEDKNGN